MTHANIDSLLQVTAPQADRAPSASRASGEAGFNRHLNQASASVFDVVRTQRPAAAASDSASSDARRPRQGTSNHEYPSGYETPASSTANPDHDCNASCSAHDEDKDEVTSIGRNHKAPAADDDQTAASVQASGGIAAKQAANQTDDSSTSEVAVDAGGVEQVDAARDDLLGKPKDAASARPINTARQTEEAASSQPEGAPLCAAESVDVAPDSDAPLANATERNNKEVTTSQLPVATNSRVTAVPNDKTGPKGSTALYAEPDSITPQAAVEAAAARDQLDPPQPDTGADVPAENKPDATEPRKEIVTAGALRASAFVAAVAAVASGDTRDADVTTTSDKPSKRSGARSESVIGPLGRALRATSDLGRGERSTNSGETPLVDPARFVGRVAKAFQAAHERGGTLQLRLSPPELGALKIQLTVKEGVLSAALETENPHARRLLLDHLPALRDRLAEQNIRIQQFDVDVKQENGSEQSNSQGSNRNPYHQHPEHTAQRRERSSINHREATPVDVPALVQRTNATGINFVA